MKKVLVNKNGYLESPYFTDCSIEVEVSDEQFEQLSSIPFDFNWRYVEGDFILEPLLTDDNLKARRERECFQIVDNRSPMWYNHLDAAKKAELDAWYQAWLDVTETKVVPTKPEWLD